jgi:hypothetical protein
LLCCKVACLFCCVQGYVIVALQGARLRDCAMLILKISAT